MGQDLINRTEVCPKNARFLTVTALVFVGTLNQTAVHPREIFHQAIRHHAASILVAHNHPSGDPTPSPEDIDFTKKLVEAGNTIGIPVQDHLVIGRGRYVSLRQNGCLSF